MIPVRYWLPMLWAAAVATLVLLCRLRFRTLAGKILDFLSLLISYDWVSNLRHFRMSHCRRCELFDAKRQTCGRASLTKESWYESPRTGRSEPYGCWCYLPVKAATPCNCWLYERTNGESGWPAALNSFPL